MKIVVLDGHTLNPGDNPWDEIEAVGELTVYDRTESRQVAERVKDAEIIITNKVPLPREVMDQVPELKLIAVSATGFDMVDIEAAGQRGIPVCNVPEYGTETVAQYVFSLILELARQPALHDAAVRRGEWAEQPYWCFWKKQLIELAGRTMGIVGFGRIGRRVGELAHAFKMNVIAYDPYNQENPWFSPFAWKSIEEVFTDSDFISLNCSQTKDNIGFVNRDLLFKMKKNAFLINASRGGLVNEPDLTQALNEERIAGAALDVVSVEPIQPDNPLLHAKNVIITPHIAWATLEARRRLMKETAENVKAFIRGTPRNVVNSPAQHR
ncbi:MAG: D-2-hydroxyacid dehydrogenase [Deltaproteobacteria bacterium]|nr:D-2-hydroxyacid dehydrogenase [Deltaproteobacteria bacterium]MBW2153865.1 D-2-hydroxyacid dehydrogenase [Deltaproteobacteria bacterium]